MEAFDWIIKLYTYIIAMEQFETYWLVRINKFLTKQKFSLGTGQKIGDSICE